MKCPHCGKTITAKTIARALASKGGSVSSEAKRQAALDREAKKRLSLESVVKEKKAK